ncbi:hypothetical protein Van01_58970 [Micromonospora andamanensis]|uniref:Uncharacterized protein n=1 Tax=Micromonospora andamanensis TaxID=1287068 RepID=A0ABQ4I457_9ACTN|nr:hypothetical protein Van01_58970 [Micromonospora andamanensis]
MPVLQHDRTGLEADDGPAEAGIGVLDHEIRVGLDLRGHLPPPPVPRQHVLAVPPPHPATLIPRPTHPNPDTPHPSHPLAIMQLWHVTKAVNISQSPTTTA